MRKLSFLALIATLIIGCSKDDDGDFIAPVTHEIHVAYDENYENENAAGAVISLENIEDGRSYEATTNAEGRAVVEVVPGSYQINISKTMTAEEYFDFSGQEVETEVSFNGSAENISISENGSSTSLEIVTGTIGNLLIKQIYYNGSDVRLGAVFRDQFVEIHNNSNEIQYLDGLYLAQVYGNGSTPSTNESYHQASGQYDWSQSLGQDKENPNSDYIYADEVLKVPGSGEEYPLAPGESAIIAATAINHKQPLVIEDEDGETQTYEVAEPERTVDLSQVRFEAYFRPYMESTGGNFLDYDIDNPNVTNVEVIFKSSGGRDFILDTHGREALAIFYSDDENISSWGEYPAPDQNEIDEETSLYLQIPNEVILDGVELQYNNPAKQKPKRLTSQIDAGETTTPNGAFSSQSVIRKVAGEIDGRIYYQDTNNSSNDFEFLDRPQVKTN
ncbi:hypothetical protein APR41_04470 [Salegentibacter salinarum]|uniref:DUF4876 domain-containing protein n=1 Tax=Salegentibacter salinarum TaxID=447422 RepID=A0A2N0TUL4_9FLAO|nr:DUF4876 domain-containing protein [Salegentibacter salinarum]PKD18411.1 hypothetical protein APR41_04470 [Salegentibacter salinarum]SKB45368.1 Protein of unknown function [Salegentibacter salinarum]